MSRKIPAIKLPKEVVIRASLSPKRMGVVDRAYLKSYAVASQSYNKHKNDNLKKVIRETSDD